MKTGLNINSVSLLYKEGEKHTHIHTHTYTNRIMHFKGHSLKEHYNYSLQDRDYWRAACECIFEPSGPISH